VRVRFAVDQAQRISMQNVLANVLRSWRRRLLCIHAAGLFQPKNKKAVKKQRMCGKFKIPGRLRFVQSEYAAATALLKVPESNS